MVGCIPMVRSKSALVAPHLIAQAKPCITSPALGLLMCKPTIRFWRNEKKVEVSYQLCTQMFKIYVMWLEPHLILFITDQLGIADVVFFLRNCPLQWPKVSVKYFQVIFSKLCLGIFFGVTTTAVLQRSEDCSWNIHVVALKKGDALYAWLSFDCLCTVTKNALECLPRYCYQHTVVVPATCQLQ